MPFDQIEIEALRQPGGGSIDISLDGAVKSSADLGGDSVEPVVLRLRPDGATSDRVRQIEIRTRGTGVVSIASIGIYQKQSASRTTISAIPAPPSTSSTSSTRS